ncbi:type II toxin-antitoxin system RelE family toxin [Pseudidiomarina salilacus]|uniref:type II toxin-antitoxin system RelE family toxin n=1 Tax=Pseudidiomarina salilacus TaxID=3384452 RepID=UPI0039853868
MAKYKIEFKKSVAKDLRAIPNDQVKMILDKISALADDPRPPGCEKLSGQERYRIRQDVYRVVYSISDSLLLVTVVKIAHRKHVYQRKS